MSISKRNVRLDGNLTLVKGNAYDVSIANQLKSTRTSPWATAISHHWTVEWPTANDAMAFFDNGGEIRMSAERFDGVGTEQDLEWSAILSNMGMAIFNKHRIFSTGIGLGEQFGYASLPGTDTEIFNTNSSIIFQSYHYGSLQYTINARLDSPTKLTMSAMFITTKDTGIEYQDVETITGTIIHYVDIKKKSSLISPTTTTIIELTAGK